jgi:hypothetical protein
MANVLDFKSVIKRNNSVAKVTTQSSQPSTEDSCVYYRVVELVPLDKKRERARRTLLNAAAKLTW